jgi:hypothetical protein
VVGFAREIAVWIKSVILQENGCHSLFKTKCPASFTPFSSHHGYLPTSLGDVFYHRQLCSWLGHQLYHAARFRWAWKMQGVDVSDY